MPQDSTTSLAGLGYAFAQLQKVLATASSTSDQATADRAATKAGQWRQVLQGLISGALRIGSRQPFGARPIWATLEVVTGGFATGHLLAGGPLQAHESAWLTELGEVPTGQERAALNGFHLTEAGLARLLEMLASGGYEIAVPEEGALLVFAWLLAQGKTDAAGQLLEQIEPWFGELRFYPRPAGSAALRPDDTVCLLPASAVREQLLAHKTNAQILAQQEALLVWAPLYEQMIELFRETVEGEPPRVRPAADGTWTDAAARRFRIEGGWPCRHYQPDWPNRARQVLADCTSKLLRHQRCRRPRDSSGSFHQLHERLQRCAADPHSLTGRDVGVIRLILARHDSKQPAPAYRSVMLQHRARQVARPEHSAVAAIVAQRLASVEAGAGVEDMGALHQQVTAAEATEGVPAGATLPASIVRRLNRCWRSTPEALVKWRVITSAEMLARVLPEVTASVLSAGLVDPALRRVRGAIYRAFRRRRSLLLLNYARQVQAEELPWLAAIQPEIQLGEEVRRQAKSALRHIVLLALNHFPQTIFPNKLLQEMRALAKAGGWDLPLTDELAADIFMGGFSRTFLQAAQRAAGWLKDSVYARYYEIDYAEVERLVTEELRSPPANPADGAFARLCRQRTGLETFDGRPVSNGMIIEQAQILTTHNLAVLWRELDLEQALATSSRSYHSCTPACQLAFRLRTWIHRRTDFEAMSHHAQLIRRKQLAYAWRQMVFLISTLPEREQESFWDFFASSCRQQPRIKRLKPAADRLCAVLQQRPVSGGMLVGWSQARP